jgi:hypothetical protein
MERQAAPTRSVRDAIRSSSTRGCTARGPQEERLRLFDAVARFLGEIADRRGLVFFVDDLHWADQGTLSLLHYVVRQLRDRRVMALGTYREVELDRSRTRTLAEMERSNVPRTPGEKDRPVRKGRTKDPAARPNYTDGTRGARRTPCPASTPGSLGLADSGRAALRESRLVGVFVDGGPRPRIPGTAQPATHRFEAARGRRGGVVLVLRTAITLAVMAAPSLAVGVTFSDDTFAPGDWQIVIVIDTGGSAGASQAGGGNPGTCRSVVQGTNASTITAFHVTDAVYDPAADGPLFAIHARLDYRTLADNFMALGQSFHAVALRQDGVVYQSPLGGLASGNPPASWATFSVMDLTAGDFVPTAGGAGSPDFTANGSPIEFGFLTSNNTPPAVQRTTEVLYDNWFVELLPIPTGVESGVETASWSRVKSGYR